MAETRVGWPLGFKNGPGEDSVANHHGIATTRDPVTNAVTDVVDKYGSVAAAVVGAAAGVVRKRRTNIGTRIMGGRTAATFAVDGASGTTFHAVFRIPATADWIKPIYANGSTSVAYTVASTKCVCIRSESTEADKNGSLGPSWSADGGSTVVAVAPGASRRKLVYGPRMRLPITARNDGGTEFLVAVRAFIAAGAGTITVFGNGASGASTDYTPWASRPDGLTHLFRNETGDFVSTVTTFASTTNVSYSPIVGIQYGVRGQIINVAVFGDSIDDGQGTYKSEGWGYPAVLARAAESGLLIDFANFGWGGQSQEQTSTALTDAIADGWVPDIVFYPGGTPNVAAAPLVTGHVSAWRQYANIGCSLISDLGGVPILRTVIPVDPAVRDYGSSDSLRTAHNAALLTWENDGIDVWDFSSVMSGETDGDGQVLMREDYNLDDIHPNDAGNAAGASLALEKLRKYAL